MVSTNLSWEAHYSSIFNKAYKMLGLLCLSLSSNIHAEAKKHLYISFVHPQLLFCSILWKPYLIKDNRLIEHIQQCATKFILNDYTNDHKTCLLELNLFPLMYTLDISDTVFLIKSIKFLSHAFNIVDFVTFISGKTRLANNHKLQPTRSSNALSNNFYSNRIAGIWNALPVVDCDLGIPAIKFHLKMSYGITLSKLLVLPIPVLFHFCVHS